MREDLAPYLLGLEQHAYRDRAVDCYERLHEAARLLAAQHDGELLALHLAARLAQVDRTLATLLVAAVREATLLGTGWTRLSDEAYFAAARTQGRLADFICFWDWFIVPDATGLADTGKRQRLMTGHLLGLPEGDERQGVRLAMLSLFEASEEQAATALTFCNNLHGADGPLQRAAADRLLQAARSGELRLYANDRVDLASQVIAALGRWRVAEALPHLNALLISPPPSFTPLARTHLRRAIEQLSLARR